MDTSMDLSVAVEQLRAARAAKERAWTAYIDLLAKALADPKSLGSSKNHNGYVCLNDEKANWQLCAKVAHKALRGREHAKATSFVFELGQKVILAHGWEEREPPKVIKRMLVKKEAKEKAKKKTKWEDRIWLDGIDRRPRQYHEMFIGQYCLTIMILLGWCRLEWSDHKDYECYVVLLPNESPWGKEPTTYTQFRPFEPWWQYKDEHQHKLVKTDLGTNWKPKGWHFTGQAPSPNEDRLWHHYQEFKQRLDRSPITSITEYKQRPKVYRAQIGPPAWIGAIHKHEAVPYRINKDMLDLMEQLQANGKLNPEEADEDRHLTETFLEEARRLADHEKFYQRMHLDFRGRMYTSRSRVNYQGDEQYRSLIEFAEGMELDDSGYEALLYHAANLWEPAVLPKGHGPKFHSYVTVGKWMLEEFISYADNPIGTYDQWQTNSLSGNEIDDPLLFIRACMELRDATTKKRLIKKKGYVTHLPVEVDQSNSVIQHLALFYGDKDVTEMCNLVTESDLYTEIAKDWNDKYVAGLADVQKRKVTKKIVVPRCYGSGAERIAEEELSNISFLKDWTPEGESTGKRNSSAEDVVEAASRVYSSRKQALNAVFTVALSEPALKALKRDTGKNGTVWEDKTVEELEKILGQLKKEKNKNKKMRWSYARIIRHMQLVGLAKEGIRRVEAVVPIVKTFRSEMQGVWKEWGLPPDGEMAWATMSGFEVHFRPVYVDTEQFRVPRSKEKRIGKDRIQLRARFVSDKLNETEVKLGIQANLVHSVDATLAHFVVANSEYPVIGVHDAFAAHANNINELRLMFLYWLVHVHTSGKPLQNFRADILGEPRPEGSLGFDKRSNDALDILKEIDSNARQGRPFLEMIGA